MTDDEIRKEERRKTLEEVCEKLQGLRGRLKMKGLKLRAAGVAERVAIVRKLPEQNWP